MKCSWHSCVDEEYREMGEVFVSKGKSVMGLYLVVNEWYFGLLFIVGKNFLFKLV